MNLTEVTLELLQSSELKVNYKISGIAVITLIFQIEEGLPTRLKTRFAIGRNHSPAVIDCEEKFGMYIIGAMGIIWFIRTPCKCHDSQTLLHPCQCMCTSCHYLTTRRSSDLSTIGSRSFILFASRSCAGTSRPLDASFW